MPNAKEKVLVAMSGGVDSSVAAHLLLEAGYDVTGAFLCLAGAVEGDHDTRGCCSPQDAADARAVAAKLGIELFVLDAGRDFSRIIEYFVGEYARGRTPNPCIHCNAQVKFARLLARADDLGARFVATGHYARVQTAESGTRNPESGTGNSEPGIGNPEPGTRNPELGTRDSELDWCICRAATKDQSYALFGLPREHLHRLLLPVGQIQDKAQVRLLAAELLLPVADKPDSQDICFVSGRYSDLLRRRRPAALAPGNVVDSRGHVLGRHEGVGHFTIGQRRGLGIARGKPMYVTRLDPTSATVTIGPAEEAQADRLTASGANWHIQPPSAGSEFEATVQIRYNHAGAGARVRITGPGTFDVRFASPVTAVTPGQAAVIYDGARLLGGGWID